MKKLLLVGMLAVMSACGERVDPELTVFDLEAAMNAGRALSDTFTLNDIVEVVDIIPIETRPDALIGSAVLEHVGREYFYLKHNNAISRVDRNGKIAGTISRQGRGPGEYLDITVTDVNEKNSTIRIFDQRADKYITCDMDGGVVAEGSLLEKGVELPRFIADDYMVVRGRREGLYRHYVTDRDMNIIRGIFPMDGSLSEVDRFGLTQQVGVGSDGEAALINLATDDTLYRVTGSGMTPEAILRKGQYRRPREPIIQITTPDSPVYFISTSVNSAGDYYFIRHLVLGQIMEIWDRSRGRLVAHTDSRDGWDNFGFRFAFPSGVESRVSSFHFDGDTVAFVIDAVNAVGAVEDLQEDDNPVIVVAKLKK
jgi:hypothetical protein